MKDIASHIIDIAENTVRAQASVVKLTIEISEGENRIAFAVEDNGVGMDDETIKRVLDPFYTTRSSRKVGLGIPLLLQNAAMSNGEVEIKSTLGEGTLLTANFQLDHLDRPPVGMLFDGLVNLIISYPEINWIVNYVVNNQSFSFNLKDDLGEGAKETIQAPEMVLGLKEWFKTNINKLDNILINRQLI